MEHPLVHIVNGVPTTTSQKVAEVFGKKHHNVLRDIENIKAQVAESFGQLNFESANYLDAQGKNRPMYLLTRDAFTLLVMGYTGKEAMKFKLAYIEAFNAMEQEIQRQREAGATLPDRRPLAAMVNTWAKKSHQSHVACWRKLHTAFGIKRVTELTGSRIPHAIAWVQEKIDALPAPQQKALPAPIHFHRAWNAPISLEDLVDELGTLLDRTQNTRRPDLAPENILENICLPADPYLPQRLNAIFHSRYYVALRLIKEAHHLLYDSLNESYRLKKATISG